MDYPSSHAGRALLSQNFNIPVPPEIASQYLPYLTRLWTAIEEATGFKWRCTSWLRDSPSHQYGGALDLAPDWEKPYHQYAVHRQSDPVLYKRERLIRQLQAVSSSFPNDTPYDLAIFIEPDHLHLQVFKLNDSGAPSPIQVFKWGDVKPVYPDSSSRVQLPLLP